MRFLNFCKPNIHHKEDKMKILKQNLKSDNSTRFQVTSQIYVSSLFLDFDMTGRNCVISPITYMTFLTWQKRTPKFLGDTYKRKRLFWTPSLKCIYTWSNHALQLRGHCKWSHLCPVIEATATTTSATHNQGREPDRLDKAVCLKHL